MANEITLTAKLSFTKDGVTVTAPGVEALLRDMASSLHAQGIQTIGTSNEALDIGAVTTGGYVFLKNLDSTNYVQIQRTTGSTAIIRLNAGDVALFRFDPAVTAPYAIADTADCKLFYMILEA